MGIQINGQTDTITATDGSFTLSGNVGIPSTTELNAAAVTASGLNVTGVATATTFSGDVSGNVTGNVTGAINSTGVSTITTLNATSLVGVTTAGITTAYIGSVNDGALSGARNRIINGDMRIDQRNNGASVALSNTTTFGVDRWAIRTGTGSGHTGIRTTTAPAKFSHSTLITIGTGAVPPASASGTNYFAQAIEGLNTSDLAWGSSSAVPVTLSFWVRSSLTGSFGVLVNSQPSNRTYPILYSISSANTWEYKTLTIPGDTVSALATDNSQSIGITFSLGAGSIYLGTPNTWNTGDIRGVTGETQIVATSGATWYITGVQLESGTVATPFERRSYGQELALAQRYYETGEYYDVGGYANSSVVASVYSTVYWKVTKRTSPNLSGTNGQGTFSATNTNVSSGSFGRSNAVANRINSGTYIAEIEL